MCVQAVTLLCAISWVSTNECLDTCEVCGVSHVCVFLWPCSNCEICIVWKVKNQRHWKLVLCYIASTLRQRYRSNWRLWTGAMWPWNEAVDSGVVMVRLVFWTCSSRGKTRKIKLSKQKLKLKNSAKFRRTYIRRAKSHIVHIIDINFKTILRELPAWYRYHITGNGGVV